MPQQRMQHSTPQYADPVLRGSSPVSSLSSNPGEDLTTKYEDEMSPEEFNERMEQDIGLGHISEKERLANQSPLIRVPNHYYDPRKWPILLTHNKLN